MGTIRRFELDKIKKKYDCNVFLETGTMYGDGVDFAMQYGFDKIISIEIEPDIHKVAKEKYSNVSNVNIVLGDSSKILESCIEDIDDNIIFFLDAHFPGADAGITTYESCKSMDYDTRVPLENELNVISQRLGKYKDVIIADDLWLYEAGSYGAGDMNEHAQRYNQNITREEATGKDASFAYDLFSNTHNIEKHYPDQGYLVFMPK